MRIRTAAATLTLFLAACGGTNKEARAPEGRPSAAATRAPAPSMPEIGHTRKLSDKPLTPEQSAAYRGSVESAMNLIPPGLRVDFQKAFECQAAKNAKLQPSEQIEMDGDWIVKKTEQLKADRGAAAAC